MLKYPIHHCAMRTRTVALAAAALFTAASAHAVFKCTDPKTGKVSYSDSACPTVLNDTKMEWRPSASTNAVAPTVFVGAGRAPNADLKAPAAGTELADLYRRWIDVDSIAGATARRDLAMPVANLQEIGRRAAELKVPTCLVPARDALTKLVRASTSTYLGFMSRDLEAAAGYLSNDRDRMFRAFEGLIAGARC